MFSTIFIFKIFSDFSRYSIKKPDISAILSKRKPLSSREGFVWVERSQEMEDHKVVVGDGRARLGEKKAVMDGKSLLLSLDLEANCPETTFRVNLLKIIGIFH